MEAGKVLRRLLVKTGRAGRKRIGCWRKGNPRHVLVETEEHLFVLTWKIENAPNRSDRRFVWDPYDKVWMERDEL